MKKKFDQFNILIVGTGGQGLITLLQVISEAAMIEGYSIRTSELHGLSQRGGSVEVHIRFGREIYSPLVARNKADLVLGLEMHECLRAVYFANPGTVFMIDRTITPILGEKVYSEKEITEILKKVSKKITVIPASQICQKELGNPVTSGVYLLSLAVFKGIIPLKPVSVSNAIKKVIAEKYLEMNQKTFALAKKNARK